MKDNETPTRENRDATILPAEDKKAAERDERTPSRETPSGANRTEAPSQRS